MANDYAHIGERLRAVRTGFTDLLQAEFADRHGFNEDQYGSWERGSRRVTVEAAEKISDVYGLSLDWIYRGRRDGLSEKVSKIV